MMLHGAMILYLGALLALGATAGFFSGLLGIGGGIFYVPGLNELFILSGILPNISMHLALGTSTLVNVFNAMINISRHRKHQAINWKVVISLVPSMMVGSFTGGYVAGYIPADFLKISFALLLLFIGLRYTFMKHGESTKPIPGRIFMAFMGVIIGLITALNGLGGGVIIVPFLSRYNLKLHETVAIAAACVLPQSLFGMLGYIISGWGQPDLPLYTLGYVYWPAAIPLVIMSLLFVPIGVKLVHTLPQARIRRIFGFVLLGVCTYMLYNVRF